MKMRDQRKIMTETSKHRGKNEKEDGVMERIGD